MSQRTHSTHPTQHRKVNNGCLETVFSNSFNNKCYIEHLLFQLIFKTAELKIMTVSQIFYVVEKEKEAESNLFEEENTVCQSV